MLLNTIKIMSVILLSLGLCTESQSEKVCTKAQSEISNKEVVSHEESTSAAISLNNYATPFEGNLFIKSMHIHLIFNQKDKQGNYHSWMVPENFLHTASTVDYIIPYNDSIVCIESNDCNENEIIVYNKNLTIKKREKIINFAPAYIYENLLYGDTFTDDFDKRIIQSIDLNDLKMKEIYSYDGNIAESQSDYIINSKGEIIVFKINDKRNKTHYYKCDDGKLTPILETKLSKPIYYDSRGLFFLETDGDFYYGQTTEANLMLWNGSGVQMIAEIKTKDMNGELFANAIPGNVIVDKDNIVSIHQLSKEPYILIQKIGSKKYKKTLLKTWNFTEADMERNGETFSGIYYNNGKIINYFFSKTSGMLQTQVIDITKSKKR